MYVDDQAFNFMALESYLWRMKVESECYAEPETALQVFKSSLEKKCCNTGFPLVFTDIFMPGIDGFELASKMLKLQQKKDKWLGLTESKFTVVALTGHVDDTVT